MRRKHSETWLSIAESCRQYRWDENRLYERGKMVLELYRSLCWKTRARAVDIRNELIDYSSRDLDGALIYLEAFAPDMERERFQSRIESLFKTRELVEMVDTAMLEVKTFPVYGDEYFDLLSIKYLNSFCYKESEMLEVLDMERSTFFDKKKDAILVFAYAFLGGVLPKCKDIESEVIDEAEGFNERYYGT